MALIGQIAINMMAKTENLRKGLKAASAAVNSFGSRTGTRLADFFSPVTAAVRATGASLAYTGTRLADFFSSVTAAVRATGASLAYTGTRLADFFSPVTADRTRNRSFVGLCRTADRRCDRQDLSVG